MTAENQQMNTTTEQSMAARLRNLVADLRARQAKLFAKRDRLSDDYLAVANGRAAQEVRQVADRLDAILASTMPSSSDGTFCRGCAAPILQEPFGERDWYTPDGSGFCDPAGKVKHQPRTGCRVHDEIVTWDQVAEGDLAADRGLLVSIAATEDDASQPAYVRLKMSPSRDPKLDRWVWRRRDHYTAVRRYIETSED